MLSDLLGIIIQASAENAEAIRCQDPSVQHVGLVLLVGFILFVRNLLHGNLR